MATRCADCARGDDALAAYKTAIEKRPNFAEAINNLAMCLCWLNRLEEGVEQFNAAIRLSPAEADLHNNLGTALTHLGRL